MAAGIAVALILAPRFSPHLYAGTVLQQNEPAPPMDGLRFASGQPVDLDRFDQQLVVVFFGYTSCPDVCPMTLSTIRRALDLLPPELRGRVATIMVSVDPERDDLAWLQEYVGFFDPSFLGVGGPTDAVDRAAARYGVYYRIDDLVDDAGNYLVDHTASLMGIAPDGSLRIVWAPDVSAEALARDMEELLS
jgi:protein SCO1/2